MKRVLTFFPHNITFIMKYALLSDIHSNLEAFQAVIKDLEYEQVDHVCFLGDIVGYGADPDQCIDLLQGLTSRVVAGNHDWAAVGLTDTTYFNPVAKSAIDWTSEKISPSHRKFLKTLPLTHLLPPIQLVHATPHKPETWNYIFSLKEALNGFNNCAHPICFIGHSHSPVAFVEKREGKVSLMPDRSFQIRNEHRYIINVGSVGQPRDGDPRAAYGIYDSENTSFTLKRIAYPIEDTQKKIVEAGLPPFLASRLSEGR
jgi:diadenosine tetraphosphatase ApaH/serine/threonine PP2A family protein phosphatase